MPIQIHCPSCDRALRLPDDLIGKQVKCPGCSTMFTANGDEPPAGPAPPPRSARNDAVQEEEAPRPSRRGRREEEEEEAPRRSRRDDDYDDRPRRRTGGGNFAPHRGGLILGLGIASIALALFCTPLSLMGIAPWMMGRTDLRAIREGHMDPEGQGMTTAGFVMGIIGTIIGILSIVGICLYFLLVALVFGAAASGAAGS